MPIITDALTSATVRTAYSTGYGITINDPACRTYYYVDALDVAAAVRAHNTYADVADVLNARAAAVFVRP